MCQSREFVGYLLSMNYKHKFHTRIKPFDMYGWTYKNMVLYLVFGNEHVECNFTLIIWNHYVKVWIFFIVINWCNHCCGYYIIYCNCTFWSHSWSLSNQRWIYLSFFIFWRAKVFTKAFTQTLSIASYCRSRERSHVCLNNF